MIDVRAVRLLSIVLAVGVLAAASQAVGGTICEVTGDIRVSGAKGDGVTKDTQAIQRAIDDLFARGGGTLKIGSGQYLTGALFFRPGVKLHLERGAILRGSGSPSDYPQCETRIEGETRVYYPALINADQCDGFAITGEGVIDGDGFATWKAFYEGRKADPQHFRNQDPSLLRPRLVYVSNSSNVSVSGVTLKNSRFWTTHFYRCNRVSVRDCRILSERIDGICGPSSDGIDLDFCRDVTIRGVEINVGDDAVAIKGGKGAWADDRSRHPENGPTEAVLIENCKFGDRCHSCLTVGSECPAATNIVMRNCQVDRANWMLHVKMRTDTPQHYSSILVEKCRGVCYTAVNVAAWTQYAKFEGRSPADLMSYGDSITVRACALKCIDEPVTVATDDRYFRLTNFAVDVK